MNTQVHTAAALPYSLPLLLLLTLCLLFAEHHSAKEMHGGIMDREYILSGRGGQLPREAAYLVLGLVGAIGIVREKRAAKASPRWNRFLATAVGLLLAWSALSLLWSTIPEITARRLLVVGLMMTGALGLVLSWSRTEILKFIVWSAALQIAVGFAAEVYYGYFTPLAADYRFGGTLHWNQQGYLCLVLFLAASCLAGRGRSWRGLYATLAAFALVFLLLTRSRSSLLGLALSIAIYFFIVLDAPRKVLSALLLAAAAMALMMSGTAPRLFNLLDRGGEGGADLTGRAPLWQQCMDYVQQRPWLGYGYEGFWTDRTIDDISDEQHWAIDAAHSGYIESLLTIGAVGTVLHLLALLAGLTAGIRLYISTRDLTYYLAASLCAIYLAGGVLESVLIVKPSPISFYFAMLLWLTALGPRGEMDASTVTIPGAPGALRARRSANLPAGVCNDAC